MLIVFDCDGVLVDSEIIAARVLAALLGRHGCPITAEDCVRRFTGRTIAGVIDLVRGSGAELPDDFESQLADLDAAAFQRDLRPVPGVPETLTRLAGTAMCVASSGSPEKIRRSLTLTGLLRYFEPHLFSAKDVAKPKPAPDLFYLAAARMNVPVSECLVIEDSPLGVEGAKRAGMRVLGFIGGAHRTPADAEPLRAAGAERVFADMRALPDLI